MTKQCATDDTELTDDLPSEDIGDDFEASETTTYDFQKARSQMQPRERFLFDFDTRHVAFVHECWIAHNNCRVHHSIPPFKLSKKLCKLSLEWASYLASMGRIRHRRNHELGENIYLMWPTKQNYIMKGNEPVDYWYNGCKYYVFGGEPRNLLSLHFTQIVWKDTTHFGAGISMSDDGKIFVVATYSPAGNIMGKFPQQVLPRPGMEEEEAGIKDEADLFSEKQLEALRLHNDIRQRHGAPHLSLHPALISSAMEWAKRLCEEERFAYRIENTLGENIYQFESNDVNVRAQIGICSAISSWYNEMDNYEFGAEPPDAKARNFTQMVWRSSRYMGMAVAFGQHGRVIMVANYYPRGNLMGLYAENVGEPMGGPLRFSSLQTNARSGSGSMIAAAGKKKQTIDSVASKSSKITNVDEVSVPQSKRVRSSKEIDSDGSQLIW